MQVLAEGHAVRGHISLGVCAPFCDGGVHSCFRQPLCASLPEGALLCNVAVRARFPITHQLVVPLAAGGVHMALILSQDATIKKKTRVHILCSLWQRTTAYCTYSVYSVCTTQVAPEMNLFQCKPLECLADSALALR